MEITKEVKDYYINRTQNHINNVKLVFNIILNYIEVGLDFSRLLKNIENHDLTKFFKEQEHAYIIFTWKKKNNIELTKEEKDMFSNAWKHHYMNETHHPEKHMGNGIFDKVECIEIFCDLQAMAIEFNEGSCRKYFETIWLDKSLKYYKEEERESVRNYIDGLITLYETLKNINKE